MTEPRPLRPNPFFALFAGKFLFYKAILGLATFLLLSDVSAATRDGCLNCHRRLPGKAGTATRLFELSVHPQVGLSCVSCHGGDAGATEAAQAKRPGTGYKPSPAFKEVPTLCGSCHSSAQYIKHYNPRLRIDQVSEYYTSVHGQQSARGDTLVATCTSCHSTHDIRRATDPESAVYRLNIAGMCGKCHSDPKRMQRYGLSVDQVALYKQSKHGIALNQRRDVSSPTCTDCHGSHGSVPPAGPALVNVCSHCHDTEVDLFRKSTHYSAFTARRLNTCIVCHQSHGADPPENALFTGMTSACVSCHRGDEGGTVAEQLAHGGLALRQSVAFSKKFLTDAAKTGIDVAAPMASLELALSKLKIARAEVHSLNDSKIASSVGEGLKLSDSAYRSGMRSLEQTKVRSNAMYLSFAFAGFVILLGGVSFGRSLRERRRERELVRLERERIQLSRERLARVGEISSGVAHTIRNPLHGLLNCVDLLKVRMGPDHPHHDILSMMSEGLQRIQSVTQRLLVLTRETPLNRTENDISALIKDTIRFIDVRCQKKGIRIQLELNADVPVAVDSNQISEALLNVLDNAIDASPAGGAITVRTFISRSGADQLHIEVQDTGHGITAENLTKIFHPFFTTKPIGEGTGLGLSITRRVIEEHGGRVTLTSEPGIGSLVTFTIPLSGPETRNNMLSS